MESTIQRDANKRLEWLLRRARVDAREYQTLLERDPHTAQVRLAGMAHALVPTGVLSRDLPQALDRLSGPHAVAVVMYQIGYLIGHAHCKHFLESSGRVDEELLYRVMSGPFHFAWAGYGDVDLLVLDVREDQGFAVLWETGNSFSAAEAIRAGERRRSCYMQAGYSAGWCSMATGLPLVTTELACRAEGVRYCRFLISHEDATDRRMTEARFHHERCHYHVVSARMPAP